MQKAKFLSVVRSLNQVESKTIKHFKVKCLKGLHINIESLSCKFVCKDQHQMLHCELNFQWAKQTFINAG